jgi:hypothetical protein
VKKEQLLNLAQKRGGFSVSDVSNLEHLAGQYPYFSGAHILLSMAFGETHDHRRITQIGATAARVSSRGLLKSLTSPKEPHIGIMAQSNETRSSGIADIILTEESEDWEVTKTGDTALVFSEESIETESGLAQTESAQGTKLNDLEELQTGILLEAIQSSIEMEVADDKIFKHASEPDEVHLSSYAKWLIQRAEALESESPSGGSQIYPLMSIEDESTTETSPNLIFENEERPRTQTNWTVIDRFIEADPQIARGKAGAYSPGDLTRGSFREEDDFYTETMAILLTQQGKTEKAKMVYRKLMTLHPEKSIYFAAQLKKL